MSPHLFTLPGMTRRFRLLACLLTVVALLAIPGLVQAEGSGTFYPDQPNVGARANIEWRTSTYGPDLARRTLMKVFANQGEYILLGSSAIDVSQVPNRAFRSPNNGDILIYGPDHPVTGVFGKETIPTTASFSCVQQRQQTGSTAQGRIGSRVQELAGPDAITNPATAAPAGQVANGFVPCYYQAPATDVYSVVFYGPAGGNSNDEPPISGVVAQDARNFDARQSTSVAAWDVTVRAGLSDATTSKTGRLFTYYIAANTGNNGRMVQSRIFVVTNDGFRYKISSRGHDPYGWVSYANKLGFIDKDDSGNEQPLYRDVLADPTLPVKEQNQLFVVQGGVILDEPEYPMFVNEPDPAVLQFLGIPTQPIVPQVENLQFRGPGGKNETFEGVGGTFQFATTTNGVFEVVISRDGQNFDPTNPLNRALRGVVNQPGTAEVQWDGKDAAGNNFPIGDVYRARMNVHGGEVHFPALDIENSIEGGAELELLNPPGNNCFAFNGRCTGAFYDDRGYRTANGTIVGTAINGSLCAPDANGNQVGIPPLVLFSPPEQAYDSASTERAYGFPTSGNARVKVCDSDGGFGDKKGLDKWTYYPSQEVFAPLRIVGPSAVQLTSFTAQPEQDGIQVAWSTAAEVDTFGFHVLRSVDGNRANAQRITVSLIPAKGGTLGGAVYGVLDTSAIPGGAYRYWLQEVETSGAVNEYGPITAPALPKKGDFERRPPESKR